MRIAVISDIHGNLPAFEAVLEDLAGREVDQVIINGDVINTGPDSVARLLRRHPRLHLVVAHMGAPEYEDFLVLAERHGNVHLDTTMVFTDFFDRDAPYPADLLPRLRDLQPRIVLGSDFPTIPYPYHHQLEGLARLGLGDDWLRDVCWHNARRLLDPS